MNTAPQSPLIAPEPLGGTTSAQVHLLAGTLPAARAMHIVGVLRGDIDPYPEDIPFFPLEVAAAFLRVEWLYTEATTLTYDDDGVQCDPTRKESLS